MHANDTVLKVVAGRPDQFPRDSKPQIALSGRSNVGKSSLINRLVGVKNFARVSSVPGKTVTVNFYESEGRFYLVDLPGYGYAARSGAGREALSAVADRYFRKNTSLSLVLQLVDLKVGPTADDRMMLSFLEENAVPYAVVATKADKLSATAKAKQLVLISEVVGDVPLIPFSAVTGEGKEEIKKLIGAFSRKKAAEHEA